VKYESLNRGCNSGLFVGKLPLKGYEGYGSAIDVLEPLSPLVVRQAVIDQKFLAFKSVNDLGGFRPASVGQLTLSGGGTSTGVPMVRTRSRRSRRPPAAT
jgi:hypothetical protein